MNNSSEEIAQWVDMYAEKLLDRAIFLLSNKEDAEDVVQEVFLTAVATRDKFQQKSSPLTWLNSILNHKIADFYKRKYKFQQVDFENFFDDEGLWREDIVMREWENIEETSELFDNQEFAKVFKECLDRLPPKWSILVKMCYLEGKKSSEICQEMNINPTNYWKILQRSRLQLRECLELNWFNK